MSLTVPKAGLVAGRSASPQFEAPQIGAAVAAFGDQMQQIGTTLEHDRLGRELQRTRLNVVQGLNGLRGEFDQMTDPDAIDTQFGPRAAELREQLTGSLDPRIRADAQLIYDDLQMGHRTALGSRAVALRNSQAAAYRNQIVEETVRGAALADPATQAALIGTFEDSLLEDVRQGRLSENSAAGLRANVQRQMEELQAIDLMENDPAALVTRINAGEFWANDPKQLVTWRARAQSAAATAEAARARTAEVQNSAARTVLVEGADESLSFLQANGYLPPTAVPSEALQAQLVALGANDADATAAADRYAQGIVTGQAVYNAARMTPAELRVWGDALAARIPEQGNTDQDVKDFNAFAAAVAARNTALATDPANHAVSVEPDLQLALNAAVSNDAEQSANGVGIYKSTLAGTYDMLGVPEDRRALLPARVATQIVSGLQHDGIDIAPQRLAAIREHWSDPRLIPELVAAGLPAEYASALRHADSPGLATAILGTVGLTDAELRQRVSAADSKVIADTLSSQLGGYFAAMEAGDPTGTATRMMASEAGIAERLALKYRREGKSASDAADAVVRQMFPETVISNSFIKLVVPVGGPDTRTVEQGLANAMDADALSAATIDPLDDPRFPEFADREVSAAAARNGVWLLNGTSTGAVLNFDLGGYYLPVTVNGGKKYEVLFDDVASWTWQSGFGP